MIKILIGVVVLCLLLACSAILPGIPKLYEKPIDPSCVKEVFKREFNGLPAMIVKKSVGFFDFKGCEVSSIGSAWVNEKKLRQKYENQLKALNWVLHLQALTQT